VEGPLGQAATGCASGAKLCTPLLPLSAIAFAWLLITYIGGGLSATILLLNAAGRFAIDDPVIGDEELFRWLHDPDEGVRRLARRWPDLDPAVCEHLVHLYGSLADEVLGPAMAEPDLLHPIHPAGPDLAAQALYARDAEWACRPEDVLRRRTTLALRGLADEEVVRRVDELFKTRDGEAPRAASAPSSQPR